MKLFDSHCHIDDQAYDQDRKAVIENAIKSNVCGMMVVSITEDSAKKAVQIASEYPQCYASVGIHPHDAKACSENVLSVLTELCQHPRVKAWGETGLDFNRMYSSQSDQEKWFIRQLEIAQEHNMALIFHERDSKGRFLEILKSYDPVERKGVVHCFSGSKKELKAYLDLNYEIGITGILTLKQRGDDLRRMVTYIPKERILIETDAPYLTPFPEKKKNRRNEPAFVRSTFNKLCDIHTSDPHELAKTIWDTTCRLFDIMDHRA
ncbi:MAG: TatD DNase family protein [Candidatus Magnetoglobus multicellularis str. Araruama]|uniref:TatD DNase family protein n=1 Tax=Candidatus Magnetoglobus multicellularis str. Araruama TaxID=890399 RepID=A0A1V1P9Y1_9BACT|nr:MAG: TatD DNase family protein [Candidatus Magnetoglobus multicellularis str. Araruama]